MRFAWLEGECGGASTDVLGLSQSSVGDHELRQQRQRIQHLAEDTNAQLKRNVYMNYMQFIDTAKEISYLESEMYQLSHLITEQKSLLTSVLELSITGERGPGCAAQEMIEVNPQELKKMQNRENRKKLTGLLEKIEGCSGLQILMNNCETLKRSELFGVCTRAGVIKDSYHLPAFTCTAFPQHVMEVEDRCLVFDGDLVELNQDDYTALQRIHAYLLNDSLMIASWLSDRRGPVRYKFEVLYPLDQVLPVNIKDRGNTKNAFKVLIFPDTRVFMAPTAKSKQDWLDEIERTKANKVTVDKQNVERAQQQHQKERQLSLSKEDSLDSNSNNPFGEDDDSLNPFMEAQPPSLGPPEWVLELPEELDQAIAQRNFEDAVALVDSGREYFDMSPKTPAYSEMRRALESRVKSLVEVLQAELRVTPDKSLQGGPRAARRATTLLVHLNKSSEACELFLGHRGAILKAGLKRLRLEGKTVLYVRQLCSIFFHNLLETAREFTKAFPNNPSCTSAFVVWGHGEVNNFASMFSRHVFTTQSSLNTVAECVRRADHHCQQLADIGLDLTFALHTLLLRDVEKWIRDGRDKLVEAVKLRGQEDTWKILKYENKEQLNKFIEDMNEIGIASIEKYIMDELCVGLTNNTVQFSRAFLSYLEDMLRLFWPETERLINASLTAIFSAQMRHCQTSLTEPLFKNEVPAIRRNSAFLLDVILTLGEHRYAEAVGHAHPNLPSLHAQYPALTGETAAASTTAPTISKYESNFI
ncbi:Exocyst complex component 8 [Chionoecetes opilio]|uniref:Exocyst complex component 8 n=1 Tax=Chionoecetes opilio TaxID=41210 RepID=A0A8J4YRZ3_CHIOP|nr:Exocyst complex component 8 [Chionoecetes opilio]